MKHFFIPREASKQQFSEIPLCQICMRDEKSHTNEAICDTCGKIAECDMHGRELLCSECMVNSKQNIPTPAPVDPTQERIVELTNKFIKELPSEKRLYFVSEITSIVEIENQVIATGVENAHYRVCELIEARLVKLKETFFGLQKQIEETRSALVADQKYLNDIVPKLRNEEREKFKQYDISYNPTVIKPVVIDKQPRGPRMSAEDKALESAAKMFKMTVEQYKLHLAKMVSNITGNKCTCQETPGVCKIHPK